MAVRFVSVDHDTPMLLPPNLRDWVPADHIVHFVIDAVKLLDLTSAKINHRGTGSAQYPPSMMLGLLIYSYATGTFSSRKIENLTYENLAVRFLTGDTHPDHDSICNFRRENKELLENAFHRILQRAALTQILKVGDIIEARATERSHQETEVYRQKLEDRERKQRESGHKPRGKAPAPPKQEPSSKDQYNFTDPESRIMKTGGAEIAEEMAWRTNTSAGKKLYGLRKETVEPVFGIIKETLGFRRFNLRGLVKVDLEWTLVRLAYNIKRLYHISQVEKSAVA